ncbi:SMP-30/gluconolactonase/LRE family protein [Actinotignum urinale]|uniref:SMP-30/gluconolactonase/LRE family protein n=1 Tax=Actinotignum urinale TaxID=190146 RepID=A0ABU5G6V8_9ACTO|nr:SMP-30/gluconolactonase/LRE family protein [Actinotignum urinale]MDY5132946.1 SMP-30/gluconolactonase/LRE family protein [Actinotignum urinale]
MAFEQITDVVAFHAEGPVWHESWGGLRFVDMLAGDLLTMDESGKVNRLATGSKIVAFVRPRADGGYIVATEKGLALCDTPHGTPGEALTLWENDIYRMNEGAVDPWGYVYAGCMPYVRNEDTLGTAKVWRISPNLEAVEALNNVTTSNGLDFTPDASLAYYNDTTTRGTDVFDVDETGALHNRRVFAKSGGPSPDGLTVDSEGNVWVAMNRAGQIRVYDPSGKVVEQYQLPVTGTTAVTLGGVDGKDVFVTVSRENDDSKGAGAVWWMRSPVAGQATRTFQG